MGNYTFSQILGIVNILLPFLLFGHFYGAYHSWNNSLISFSIVFIVSLISLSTYHKGKLDFDIIDISWWALLFSMFISFLWATDLSLAIFSACGWMSMYVYFVSVRHFPDKELLQWTITRIAIILFILLLLMALVTILSAGNLSVTTIGVHRNILSINLVVLFPFLLFFDSEYRFRVLLKYALTIALLFVLISSDCRGGLLAFSAILIFYGLFQI